MKYLVTILALVPSIAHAYFNSILNESTIYQNKIITNNYQKYAAITLITDEQGGLKAGSLSTPKCGEGKELYNGKCEDTKCRKQYPFTTEPDKNKGNFTHYLCFGKYRYAYTSCDEDMGWIPEMNEYNTIHDCVERPGKEDYPLYPDDIKGISDYAKTECKYFGGVKRCRINSCNDGWDAERNGAGKIIKCKFHECPEEYYSAYKLDESVGTLLPPCKVGLTYKYGYKTCNQGYSGPIKGQCYPKKCSASDGYVYTTGPIAGCKSGQTCYSGSSTYHRCIDPDDGYCMDADGYVNPCQCGAGYIYETSEIKCCESVSEPCLSGDKKLYKCLKAGDGCYIDDDGKVNPNSCEGYDYETQDIPDCLETESCLSGDKTLYKCTKPKTCDGYTELKPLCLGTIETCTVGGKTYYKCNFEREFPCKNIKNPGNYVIPKKCYEVTQNANGESSCLFYSEVGCPAIIKDYIVGTIVYAPGTSLEDLDAELAEEYKGLIVDKVIVAGLNAIDNYGNVTTEPVNWSKYRTQSTGYSLSNTNGFSNTAILSKKNGAGTPIGGVQEYEPVGCEGSEYCGKGKWYLPSKFESQLAKRTKLVGFYRSLDRETSETQADTKLIYMTSSYAPLGSKAGNHYMYAGYGELLHPAITKIATYEAQECGNDCVREAYIRPFFQMVTYLMRDKKDYDKDDDNSTPNNGDTTPSDSGINGNYGDYNSGDDLLIDGPGLDDEDDDISSHEYLKWAN